MTYDVMIIKQALVSFIIHLQQNDFLINVPFMADNEKIISFIVLSLYVKIVIIG